MTKLDIEGFGLALRNSAVAALLADPGKAGNASTQAAAQAAGVVAGEAALALFVNLCVDINRIAQAHEIIANHLESM